MLSAGHVPEGLAVIEPAVMGPPIVWLASEEAVGTHDGPHQYLQPHQRHYPPARR